MAEISTLRLQALEMKLQARQNKAEFHENCRQIRAEIARLKTMRPSA